MLDARKCKCWKLKSLHAGSSKIHMLETQKFTCCKLKNLHAASSKSYMLQAQKFICWKLKNLHLRGSKIYMLKTQKLTCLKLKNLDDASLYCIIFTSLANEMQKNILANKCAAESSNSHTSKARAKNFGVPPKREGGFRTTPPKPEKPHTNTPFCHWTPTPSRAVNPNTSLSVIFGYLVI